MSIPRWIRQVVAPPYPSPHQPGVRAAISTTGLLTALLTCGHCHTTLRADAAAETVRDEDTFRTRPMRVTDGPRSWLLEWRCPACDIPSHTTLPMVSPSGP
ncbi:hypothetical protein GHK92_19020 [Nocardioides sp. dk4132]|uniref:hypothetical protein n=1 Tax=unclassified Nocardioides TaxID=2615069 RepID=UPI0012978082|nr:MULTISPECIES: hypothetical protein [unclassified Nocardioides]MQW77964.1 hypothetical protein [Nocardioides sp. dk4132]QGA09114.1 hypothetical protein GFH29_18225 [Nocardioides sp. dk884]